MEPKIELNRVSKKYPIYPKKLDRILELFRLGIRHKSFYALSDISFRVMKGETIGIIGINGSGKSTLSNVLAQITRPSYGDMTINGETSLIAISVGLDNRLTGIENIKLKCLMHGLKMNQIEELFPKIIEFAELGDFIGQPVKSYSSGMKSRLGFAISIHTNPDILIIDEALSVGDQTFYAKCLEKIKAFKEEGKTIFYISHSTTQVKELSDRVLWLHFGKIKKLGSANEVIDEYAEFIKWYNQLNANEKKEYKNKMLATQMLKQDPHRQNHSSRRNKKQLINKNSLAIPIYELLILFVLLCTSVLFMFL